MAYAPQLEVETRQLNFPPTNAIGEGTNLSGSTQISRWALPKSTASVAPRSKLFGKPLPPTPQICAAAPLAASRNSTSEAEPWQKYRDSENDSQPTNESAVFNLASDNIYKFNQSLYVGKVQFVKIKPQHSEQWQHEVKPRLNTDLGPTMDRIRAKSRSRPTKESAVFLDFRLSGSAIGEASSVELLPSIWILCGSKWCMKMISATVKDLDWIAHCGFNLEIHLNAPKPSTGDGMDFTPVLDFDTKNYIPLPDGHKLFVHVEDPGPAAICNGVLCCTTIQRNGVPMTQKLSRIGGIMTLNETTCVAVTTGHGFFSGVEHLFVNANQDREITLSSDLKPGNEQHTDIEFDFEPETLSTPSSEPDDELLDQAATEGQLGQVPGTDVIKWINYSSMASAHFLGMGIVAKEKARDLHLEPDVQKQETLSCGADFALLELDSTWKNRLATELEGSTSPESSVAGMQPVHVLLRPETPTVAYWTHESSSYYIHGREIATHKLELPSALASGSSGSWVASRGALYGMVIATSHTECYSLAISAEQLVDNITQTIPWIESVQVTPDLCERKETVTNATDVMNVSSLASSEGWKTGPTRVTDARRAGTMATSPLPLPSRDQCYSLTDEQCRKIQEHRDPHGRRVYADWEGPYQCELIRHYMAMLSFKQIEDVMMPRLEWSYKTYMNRYRDWLFPIDLVEREKLVRTIFAWISTQEDYILPRGPVSAFQNRQLLRLVQPRPSLQPALGQQSQAPAIPGEFFFPSHISNPAFPMRLQNRTSISTMSTLASGSAPSTKSSYIYDDTFSSHRTSIATTNSSLSTTSFQVPQQLVKHDPVLGYWNGSLRVIPCGKNHSALSWEEPFSLCSVCGFSRWHSLMLHAGSIGPENLAAATISLGHVPRVDFAGNYPIHFLMSAGVSFEFFSTPFWWDDGMPQNVFGQNPLHALNPIGLGEQLIITLEWFNARENPPGLLLTQRDINCRTPLHTILQYPLERKMYQRVLHIIPFTEFYLSAPDNTGRSTVKMMYKAAMKMQIESPADYTKIQDGITDVKIFLSDAERAQNGNNRTYGFHDIARGARGVTNTLLGYYQCLICHQYNVHANSYLAQLNCAFENGRDRNGPDDTGMTPAHAFVTLARCNSDEERTPETPSQTAELFRFFIPVDDPRRGEALHALDPQGNSLVFNIATRGLHEILEYVLKLVEPSRRKAMVNACSRSPEGNEWSVLMAVKAKLDEAAKQIHIAEFTHNMALKAVVKEKGKRLYRCKTILQEAGAELNPSVTTRWRIS